jgi:hypothetical protein
VLQEFEDVMAACCEEKDENDETDDVAAGSGVSFAAFERYYEYLSMGSDTARFASILENTWGMWNADGAAPGGEQQTGGFRGLT